jgi:endoglycosylceramidase
MGARRVIGLAWVAGALALAAGGAVAGAPPGAAPGAGAAGPAASGGGGALPEGPVAEAGRWLVDREGRVLLVHGVNVVAKDAPYYPGAFGFDDADAAWLAANGMRVVRLGVLASGEMPTRGTIDEAYISKLVATVDDLGRHHIFTLLDWHQDDYGTYFTAPGTLFRADGFPAWMTLTGGATNKQAIFPHDYVTDPALEQAFQSFWDNDRVPGGEGLQTYALTMLRAVATRVAANPWVLGYEVLNEPWPGTSWAGCVTGNGCPQLDSSELDAYYDRAAAAIRAVDPRHMIFFEPFVTYDLGDAPTHITLPPGVSNTGMSFHEYGGSARTDENVFAFSLTWARTHRGALLNTEWSASGGSPASIEAEAADEDAALMPWTYWVFDNCDIACVEAKDADFLLDPRQPPAGANVNSPIVDSVVRSYPVAVAGTPQHLTFDPADRVMDFTWSPARAAAPGRGAGSFGPGAVTVFATPALVYPHGYTAHVRGGRVVSPPGSPTLAVAQVGAPATLSVTVAPRR